MNRYSFELAESKRKSCSAPSTNYLELEVTHRGMHRFIPRHKDEIAIEIGDPLHVFKQDDDLWCEGTTDIYHFLRFVKVRVIWYLLYHCL